MQNPVLKNASSGQIIELVKSPFTIGRSLTSDYVIENKIVSRIHCSLTKTEDGWTLTDSSTNGTLINDGHYKGETSPILKHNDEVSLGYDSYTYRFLTEVEKATNFQIERLKTQESNVQGNTTPSNELSPSTPNSFDENGISDDLLNDLADNMLNTVEQHSNNQLNIQTNIPLENLEQPATSPPLNSAVTSNQPGKEEDIPTTQNIPLEPTTVTIEENDLGQVTSTGDIGTSEQVDNKYEESKKENDNSDEVTQSSSNTSVSTVIYSLPDEIVSEIALPSKDNREGQTSNMNEEQIKDNGTVLVHTGSIGDSFAADTGISLPSNSACKSRDLLAESETSNKNVESTVAVEVHRVSSTGNIVENISVSGPSTSTSKPRDLLAESIEAVVNNYSDVTTMATATVSTSGQMPQARLSLNTTSSITVPTSVTMASPMNSNKKVKVMAVSPGTVNQLRTLSSADVASMIATGQQVKRITQDEMKRILARQPGVPMVVLDRGATNPNTLPTTTGHQMGASTSRPIVSTKNSRGGITTVTTSTRVSTTSSTSPGKVTVLRGIRKVHNTSLPTTSSRNMVTKTLQNYQQANTPSTAIPGTSAFSVVFNLLQTAKNISTNSTRLHNIGIQNNTTTVISGNNLLQRAENTSTTTGLSGLTFENKFQQPARIQYTASTSNSTITANTTVQSSGGHVLMASNPSISINVTAVPAVSPANSVGTIGKAASADTHSSAIKCHDSQEPGPSKAPETLVSDSWKQNNQNQYEEMENELMCTICANLFIKAVTLGCSHSFCQYCIGQWKEKKTDCPICRNKITSTIRTLVLDNIIEKMVETASEEDKAERKAAIEERKNIEDEATAKKNQLKVNKNTARRGRRGRRGYANTRGNQQQNNTARNAGPPVPVITITDSPSTTDSDNDNSDNSSNNSGYDYDDYYSDDWYNGRPGAYYGGYGRCYKCGEQGHWSNGCPFR